MNNFSKALLFCFVVVSTVSCSKKSEEFLLSSDIIVAVGDSLTYGYGTTLDKSYPVVLSGLINMTVINEGINGDTSSGVLERIDQIIKDQNPKMIILGIGGNDMLRRTPRDETVRNITEIIQIIKAANIMPIILAEPEPSVFGAAVGNLNDATLYKEIADQENVFIIENTFSKYLSNNDYKSDPIHLNEKGYALVAQDVRDFLVKKQFILD